MTRILYEDIKGDGKAVSIEIAGKPADVTQAIVRLLNQLQTTAGIDIDRFAISLPLLAALERQDLESAVTIDLSKRKSSHE